MREILTLKKKTVMLIILGTISVLSSFTVTAFSRRVHLVCDDTDAFFETPFFETEKIFSYINLELYEDDVVIRDDSDPNMINITIKRAFYVPIVFKDRRYEVKVTEGTVQDAISKSKIEIDDLSLVTPSLDTNLSKDTCIKIFERRQINLKVDGRDCNVIVPVGTLKGALDYLKVELGDYDIVNHSLDEEVYQGMEVKIDRVLYIEVTDIESIPFDVKYVSDTGRDNIISPGATGRRDKISRQKLVNGIVTETEQIKNFVVEEPIDEVRGNLRGNNKTKNNQTINENRKFTSPVSNGVLKDDQGKIVNYVKKIVGECTAYTANKNAITSTGVTAKVGRVAVNPNVIPYGSRLYICSEDGSWVYGYAVAADTGGAMMSGRVLVDLFYDTEDECYRFGRRNMAVYVLS